MKNVPFGMVVLVALASGLFGFPTLTRAQEDEPQPIVSRAISATVNYGNDSIFCPAKIVTNFDRLGMRAEQALTITVQFPAELSGQTAIAEPLDGGTLTLPENGLIIGEDGNVTFQFQAGTSFGACRIAVHQPDDTNLLQFWIVDPDHPENTPADLPGVY